MRMRSVASALTLALLAVGFAYCGDSLADALYSVSCPANIEQFDSSGYRIVFRHTGGQISVEDFFKFYRTGILGARPGCPSSQYKDSNLHFFWGETEEVLIDIFDLNNKRVTGVTFEIPQGSIDDHPKWDNWFQWQFVSDGENQQYSDMRSGPRDVDLVFQDDLAHRNLYMGKSQGECGNEYLWFSVINNKGSCWWQGAYNRDNPGTTTILYSPFKNAAHTISSLSVASKFELRLGGDFTDDSQNGYRKIFRYPNAAGVDFKDFYYEGIMDSTQDRYWFRAGEVKKDDMLRVENFESEIKAADQLLVVIYDMQGNVAEALTFQGTNNFNSWFSSKNLISSLKWNLQDIEFSHFSIHGDWWAGRRFFINKAYINCANDEGFLMVSCLPVNEWQLVCEYEDYSGGRRENREQPCAIFYTPGEDSSKWDARDDNGHYVYKMASAVEIFVK